MPGSGFDGPRTQGADRVGVLEGRYALITGASGGMGRATAVEFAKEGAKGIGLQYSRNRAAAESVAKEVRGHGAEPLLLPADVSDRKACHGIVRTFVERFRRLDALVCYAGYPFRRKTGAVDTEAMAGLPKEEAASLAKEAALGRRGEPLEIARKAVFLCSNDASFMTGVTLVVDGGYAMR